MIVRAIIIPSCGGKSTIAMSCRVGDLDTASYAGPLANSMNYLNDRAIQGDIPWEIPCGVQWAFIRAVLRKVDLETITLALHTVGAAKALDARDICILTPTPELHDKNITQRGLDIRETAIHNVESLKEEAMQYGLPITEYGSHEELTEHVNSFLGGHGTLDLEEFHAIVNQARDEVLSAWNTINEKTRRPNNKSVGGMHLNEMYAA